MSFWRSAEDVFQERAPYHAGLRLMVVVARADIIACLISYLRSFSELTALVNSSAGWNGTGSGPRISGERRGGDNGWKMPTKAVMVRRAGGPPDDDYTAGRERSRIDVTCYGSNGFEAVSVMNMVHAILVPRQGERPAGFTLVSCRVDNIRPEAGPIALVDPDTAWNYIVRPYQVAWWSLT